MISLVRCSVIWADKACTQTGGGDQAVYWQLVRAEGRPGYHNPTHPDLCAGAVSSCESVASLHAEETPVPSWRRPRQVLSGLFWAWVSVGSCPAPWWQLWSVPVAYAVQRVYVSGAWLDFVQRCNPLGCGALVTDDRHGRLRSCTSIVFFCSKWLGDKAKACSRLSES